MMYKIRFILAVLGLALGCGCNPMDLLSGGRETPQPAQNAQPQPGAYPQPGTYPQPGAYPQPGLAQQPGAVQQGLGPQSPVQPAAQPLVFPSPAPLPGQVSPIPGQQILGEEPEEMGAPPDGYPGMQPGSAPQLTNPAPVVGATPVPGTVQTAGHWRLSKVVRREHNPKTATTVMNWGGEPGNITTQIVYGKSTPSQAEVRQQWIWSAPPLTLHPNEMIQGICKGKTIAAKKSYAGMPMTGVCTIDVISPDIKWGSGCVGQCFVGSTESLRAGGEQPWQPASSGVVKAPLGQAGQVIVIRIGFSDLSSLNAGFYYHYEWQDSQAGNQVQQWCQVNCSRLQQCRREVEKVIGAKELAESIGTTPLQCVNNCAPHYSNLPPKCKECLMSSCTAMGACLKQKCGEMSK